MKLELQWQTLRNAVQRMRNELECQDPTQPLEFTLQRARLDKLKLERQRQRSGSDPQAPM